MSRLERRLLFALACIIGGAYVLRVGWVWGKVAYIMVNGSE